MGGLPSPVLQKFKRHSIIIEFSGSATYTVHPKTSPKRKKIIINYHHHHLMTIRGTHHVLV